MCGFVVGVFGCVVCVICGCVCVKVMMKVCVMCIVGVMCGNRRAGSLVVSSGRRFAFVLMVVKGEDVMCCWSCLDNMFCW